MVEGSCRGIGAAVRHEPIGWKAGPEIISDSSARTSPYLLQVLVKLNMRTK